ncbi:MAG: ankyrin repeat domain-containing protein [Elusimicrobiota bacterium]|nr:ankyrin repeat domain-containing protein [Elusimicrobiota bacterium]
MTIHNESALKSASYCRFDVVQALLEAGSDASPLKWTPLMRAIALGSPAEVRQQLTQGADLSARDLWSRTPWLLSLQTGDVEKAKLLLAAGADRADRGRCGKVPLMYPICNNHTEMLRWLLGEGFDPDDVDEYKQTPLMEAAGTGAVECARILLEAGADLQLKDHLGSTAIASTYTLEIARLLVARGADLNEMNDETRAAFTRLPLDGLFPVSREEYQAAKHPRFGKSNPEKMNLPFWRTMVTSGATAYAARTHFDGQRIYDKPVWCFRRFGKSINELPDGRIVEIAGEHEDHYDPDFYIYNDVIVHQADGTFDIFGYPKKVFPPTDFHTATLAGKFIYIIGSLGYKEARQLGRTQVYRLDSETLKIEKVQTSGDSPGWISRHKATYSEENKIRIRGGKVWASNNVSESYTDNSGEYILDLNTLFWNKIS